VLTIDNFRTALGGFRPRLLADEDGQTRASVAAVLRPGENGPELLFIHRAEDPLDPWSGHMAFPGGRVDPGDVDPLAAALRETREEVGLDLETVGEEIGRLSDMAAIGRGRLMSMVITPFVFALENSPALAPNHEVAEVVWVPVGFIADESSPALAPNHEVAEVVWVPVGFIADHSNRETMPYQRDELTLEPCYHYRDHLIWGMTLAMVDELLSLVSR
jgi:8-oxo-dGTP pyrophosphatase MutT (NUDIX family)